jgi:integrase
MIKFGRLKDCYFQDRIVKYENLFLSRTGRPLTREAIQRIIRLAGEFASVREEIRCSPHTCRHWFAQCQLRNGIDVYSLSRILGHETISITKRYLQGLMCRTTFSSAPRMWGLIVFLNLQKLCIRNLIYLCGGEYQLFRNH